MYGFAFEISTKVASFDKSLLVEGDQLSPGDVLQEVVLLPENEFPDEYQQNPLKKLVTELSKPWKFSDKATSWGYFESIQALPPGTKFKLLSTRGDSGRIIESTIELADDSEQVRFFRGLVLEPYSETRVAQSYGEAISLGIRKAKSDLVMFFGSSRCW